MKSFSYRFTFPRYVAFAALVGSLGACSTSTTPERNEPGSRNDASSNPPPADKPGPGNENAQASANSLGQLYFDWDEVSLITQHTGAYGWEVIQSYMRDHVDIAQLKSNNPDLRLFMYWETAGAYAETTDAKWPSGMPYQWVRANHPDWIVKDGSGRDVTFWDGALHLYDVGNRDYQDEWARRAIDYARSGGFYGIFGDDVNVGESFRSSWSAVPAKYSTDAKWTQAVESFLQNVSPKLKDAGLAFVPNVASAWNSDRATQVRWAKLAGGYGREHYQSWQGDDQLLGGADWAWMSALHRDVEAAGIPFFAYPHGGGSQATDKMRYTRASFLLWHDPALGGSFAYSTGGGPETGKDPYNAAWTFDLGAPSGPAVEQPSGVWTRTFAKGKIVVNSNTKTATVQQ
ncbi:putative glycoside hydrolase family 15 protein [Pendulispora brunnea]|uniref:Glycoside hydrolase family 15 protein n=1 Tax=Pendulispora brunnea TaxID=2905690 RepID=A0ABZ2K3B5_9BACT